MRDIHGIPAAVPDAYFVGAGPAILIDSDDDDGEPVGEDGAQAPEHAVEAGMMDAAKTYDDIAVGADDDDEQAHDPAEPAEPSEPAWMNEDDLDVLLAEAQEDQEVSLKKIRNEVPDIDLKMTQQASGKLSMTGCSKASKHIRFSCTMFVEAGDHA